MRALHGREVIDTAVFDGGSLRITHPRAGWLRLAGRWNAGNHLATLLANHQWPGTDDHIDD